MDKIKFDQELEAIKQKAKEEENELRRTYARHNDMFKVGDIIIDGQDILKITHKKYNLYPFYEMPCMNYYGIQLDKKLNPMKRPRIDCIFGHRAKLYEK